jgi:hypothetical protein
MQVVDFPPCVMLGEAAAHGETVPCENRDGTKGVATPIV